MRQPVVWIITLVLLPFAVAPVAAQETGTIVGRVTAAGTMEPLTGVQVQIVGTDRGALTNNEGRYIIQNVAVGSQTVSVRLMGYGTTEQTVTVEEGGTAVADFELSEEAIAVEGIVVTALGIEREERSLGYAIQDVGAEVLEQTPEVNLVQALQGQMAGVQVVQASGQPGASSRIDIRGQSTFTGGGQPLFIIDGNPVSIALDSEGMNPLGSGSGGNRAMDIDMSNVAEISVLRGAAATALYGSRAAHGAVVITTKRGEAGAPLRFEVSSSMGFDNAIIEGYQTEWAAGRDGFYCDGRRESQGGYCQEGYPGGFEDTTLGASTYPNWGPHKDSIPQEVIAAVGQPSFDDARAQYYDTAVRMENSIRASGSVGGSGSYTFGVSHLDQGYVTPTGKLERLTLSGNVSLDFTDFLRSNTSVQRIDTYNPYGESSWSGIDHTMIHVPPNVDVSDAWEEDGTPVMWGENSPHPDWIVQNEYDESRVDRWIVGQRFEVDLPAGLTLSNNLGLDTYLDERREYENERPWRTEQGLPSGGTRQEKINRTQINNDVVLSLNSTPIGESGFTVSGLVGANVWMTERSRITGIGSDIVIPDYYNVENFQTQNVFADLPEKQRLVGAYGQLTVDYQDWAFLTLTGRNDWSSTLPKDNNDFFYPSASLGVVFTDALNWQSDWLSYGKLRLSYAKVGSDAPPYSLASVYSEADAPGTHFGYYQFDPTTIDFPFRGQVGFLQGTQLGNPNIKPESTTEVEVGLDLMLLNDRARIETSYYEKRSYDQIFSVPSSATSGFTSIVRNAGDLRNQGWEVTLRGRPIQTQDFSWDLTMNWTRNRNSVIELAEGIDNLILAGYSWPSIRIVEGEPFGVIWGYGFQRNCVEETSDVCFPDQPEGELLIGTEGCVSDQGLSCEGMPLRTQSQLALANALPNWLANLSTQIRYKNFGLSALADVRNGSNILNFEIQYTTGRNGRHIFTRDRYGTEVVDGINVETGEPNDVEVVRNRDYFEGMYGYDRHENQIEPGDFIKLRQVTLSYDVPQSLLGRISVDRATLYVTGRNLAIWSDFSALDPEADVYGGSSGATQYFRQFPAPQTRGVTIGMRAGF